MLCQRSNVDLRFPNVGAPLAAPSDDLTVKTGLTGFAAVQIHDNLGPSRSQFLIGKRIIRARSN